VEAPAFQFERLTVSIKELPQWFGLEIARIVVDECLPSERTNGKAAVPVFPKCNGFGNRGSRTEASDQGRCLKCGCWRGFSKH